MLSVLVNTRGKHIRFKSLTDKKHATRAFCSNNVSFEDKTPLDNSRNNVKGLATPLFRPPSRPITSNLLLKLHGNAVIGIPKGSPIVQKAKAKRLMKLTTQGKNFMSTTNMIKTVKKMFFALDGLLSNIYRGTFNALFTVVFRPKKAWQSIKNGWGVVKHEAKYYWAGFKLFGLEFRTSVKLASKRITGHSLTRREHKQLVRTSADLLRLIPFSFFIVVPLMEFLLPVALKLFPGMLPSTFQDNFKQEENMKKQLKIRIDIAEFLQDMVIDMGQKKVKGNESEVDNNGEASITVEDLEKFIHEIRLGKPVPPDLLFNISKLFSDELTIDNMSRSELVLLCRYMEIPTYGGTNFLRLQLRQKINTLRRDDHTIFFEGVDSLNLVELKQACQERGMRATGVSREHLQKQLKQWIKLSVNKNVPTSLLILSRAFIINDFNDDSKYSDALKEAIGQYDNNMAKIALAENLSSLKGVRTDSATLTEQKLEAVRLQNHLIEEEKGLVRKIEKNLNQEKSSEVLSLVREMKDPAIESAFEKLEELSLDSAVQKELEALHGVITKQVEYDASAALDAGRIRKSSSLEDPAHENDTQESGKDKTRTRLQKRVEKMLKNLETDVDKAGSTIGDKLKLLDIDRDGKISVEELKKALKGFKEKFSEEETAFILSSLDLDNDGTVTMEDLNKAASLYAEKKKKEEE